MTSLFAEMMSNDVIAIFFRVSHFKFSYWSKFLIKIITSSGLRKKSNYKGLIINLKIGNTPI